MANESQKDKAAESSSAASSAGQVLAGNVKWIVGGVIALVGMVLFKEPLVKLLDRAENVEITTSGIKVGTVKTPLGDTVISNKGVLPAASTSANIGGAATSPSANIGPPAVVGFETARDGEAGFAISWPANSGWSSHPESARQFNARIVLANVSAASENFVPNVNVMVTRDAAGMDITQYLTRTVQLVSSLGWEVSAQQADDATQSGVLVSVNRQMGTSQIQRIVLRNGMSYVITASRAEGDTREDLYAVMGQILNSFELI
jgi:hypothetical protein